MNHFLDVIVTTIIYTFVIYMCIVVPLCYSSRLVCFNSQPLVCRIEELHLKKSSGILKSVGTIISMLGASIVTLYGPAILNKAIALNSSTPPVTRTKLGPRRNSSSNRCFLNCSLVYSSGSTHVNCSFCGYKKMRTIIMP